MVGWKSGGRAPKGHLVPSAPRVTLTALPAGEQRCKCRLGSDGTAASLLAVITMTATPHLLGLASRQAPHPTHLLATWNPGGDTEAAAWRHHRGHQDTLSLVNSAPVFPVPSSSPLWHPLQDPPDWLRSQGAV